MSIDNSGKNVIPFASGLHEAADAPDTSEQVTRPQDEVCPLCFGTGTWQHPSKGPILCDCRRSNARDRLFKAARVPQRFVNCRLTDYKCQNQSQEKALRFASSALDYPAIDRGLLFMGPVGVGKTHLAVGIINGLMETKGIRSLFYEFGSLLKEIQESYSPISNSSELSVLAPVYQAEVLVLDELGASVPTGWVQDTMYQIINRRYNDRKLTIFTTNYRDEARIVPAEEPTNSLRQVRPNSDRIREMTTLEDRIGARLRSRLYEMCNKIEIEGEDFRKTEGKRGY
jgi:DNA replication protein DnaC